MASIFRDETDEQIEARFAESDKAEAELARKMRIARAREHVAALKARAEARLRPAPGDLTPEEAYRAELAATTFSQILRLSSNASWLRAMRASPRSRRALVRRVST